MEQAAGAGGIPRRHADAKQGAVQRRWGAGPQLDSLRLPVFELLIRHQAGTSCCYMCR